MRKTIELGRETKNFPVDITIESSKPMKVIMHVDTIVGGASVSMTHAEVRELIETLSEFLEQS